MQSAKSHNIVLKFDRVLKAMNAVLEYLHIVLLECTYFSMAQAHLYNLKTPICAH